MHGDPARQFRDEVCSFSITGGGLFDRCCYRGAHCVADGSGIRFGIFAAGIIIGPVMGLVGSETADLQHFAEFGVVMMLFVIGLELEPRALWDMRHKLLGLGGCKSRAPLR